MPTLQMPNGTLLCLRPLLTSKSFFPSQISQIKIIQHKGDAVEQNKRSPSDFLKAVLGRPVNVRLNSGTDYRGKSAL